ncbi:MAG: hypothetical protein COC14_00185 [Burkholderiaceae bacterium]|nr:MAG: hypothetical protein COC14_00185 [Burkholderiaceae bacterium]
MTYKANAKVDVNVNLKAKLETKAAILGMGYRDFLVSLIDQATEKEVVYVDEGPTKQTRLALSEATKEKQFAKQANCSQEQWLLNVLHVAMEVHD